jgi:hypothetical protein
MNSSPFSTGFHHACNYGAKIFGFGGSTDEAEAKQILKKSKKANLLCGTQRQ